MADTPILNYKGKYDGPEIDKAIELALGLENLESCPYYVHVSLSKPDYVLTVGLGDAEGNIFNHAEIDLPLESMVVNAAYENGNIILHLQDGTSTEPIPISALIAGLVSETRTIAGIDLKDDITQKELRDALGVYTKDSVDQLVLEVEESVSELTPQVEQNKSDISLNEQEIARVETSLQNQIDGIVLEASESGDVTAEVVQARTNTGGTTYTTLKARLDAFDTATDVIDEKIDKEITRVKKALSPKVIMKEPNGFDWTDSPIHGKIYTDYKGTVKVDYDASENAVIGKTYYVDPVNGRADNDGLTPETALRTMALAYNKPDIKVMRLLNGVYGMIHSLRGITIEKDLSIIGEGDDVYITSHSGSTFEKSSDYTNVYQSNRGMITSVYDMSNTDIYGGWLQYKSVSSVEKVEEVAGSYAHISGVLYIHTFDERMPDKNLLLGAGGSNIKMVGGYTLYLENLKVVEGLNPLDVEDSGGNIHPKVYAKNCEFSYTYDEIRDTVALKGVEIAIFQNCVARCSMKDGFNYHAKNGVIPKVIEIGCTAYGCGNSDNNDQGSTIHDAGKIIRVNGVYFDNIGGNIADETQGTQSWNIGCVSYNSKGANGGYNTNFFCYPNVEMWLDSCVGYGSEINLYVSEGGSIKTRFCDFTSPKTFASMTERVTEY